MAKDGVIKRAFIAGAGAALSYKEKHPHAGESEIMSSVTRQMEKLIKGIEKDE